MPVVSVSAWVCLAPGEETGAKPAGGALFLGSHPACFGADGEPRPCRRRAFARTRTHPHAGPGAPRGRLSAGVTAACPGEGGESPFHTHPHPHPQGFAQMLLSRTGLGPCHVPASWRCLPSFKVFSGELLKTFPSVHKRTVSIATSL